MKTISKETIAKIRAQYLGCNVLNRERSNYEQDQLEEVTANCLFHPPHWFLSLRSIEDLTDEEAIKLANLQDWKDYSEPLSKDDKNGIRDQIRVSLKNQWLNFLTVDYLRQKSFVTPFYDAETDTLYSVEELVELGVYKIKNN